jgi:DNA-binding beta-propeller fold protein YncE
MAGPAGLAIVPEPQGQVTIYIADYYNGRVRAVAPDGIIRDVGEEGRVTFGEPTRVAFAPRRELLWVADSSRDRLVSLSIRRSGTATTPIRLLTAPGATTPKGASD